MNWTLIMTIWEYADPDVFEVGAYTVLAWYIVGAAMGAVLNLFKKS